MERYRRVQRRLRRIFAPFPREVCPECPPPCGRRPAALTPFDLALAEERGGPLPAGPEAAGDGAAVPLGLIPVPP